MKVKDNVLKKKFEHWNWVIMFSNDSNISFISFSSKMILGMEGINGVLKQPWEGGIPNTSMESPLSSPPELMSLGVPNRPILSLQNVGWDLHRALYAMLSSVRSAWNIWAYRSSCGKLFSLAPLHIYVSIQKTKTK